MKTYMHNSKQGDVVLINESVNKILANAMKNKNNQNLPNKVHIFGFILVILKLCINISYYLK